jgi:hypothetical protein
MMRSECLDVKVKNKRHPDHQEDELVMSNPYQFDPKSALKDWCDRHFMSKSLVQRQKNPPKVEHNKFPDRLPFET